MLTTVGNQIYTSDKGKRNAIFILILVFGFPAIALLNYGFEVRNGLISQGFRFMNLLISFFLIYEFIKEKRYSILLPSFSLRYFLTANGSFLLFIIFWVFYLIRMVIDLEIHQIHEITLTPSSKGYFYLFTIGITFIPMLAAATINKIDFDFLNKTLLLYLKILCSVLFINFFFDKLYNNQVGYRYIVSRNEQDYFDAISIAVYGGLLVLMSFLNIEKSKWNYTFIIIGTFLILTTASRGPILSILLSLIFILVFIDKKFSLKYLYLLISIAVATGLNYLISVVFDKYFIAGNPLLHRLRNFNDDQSTVNRLKIIKDAIAQILEKPIFGSHFLVLESKMYAHNILLDILVSTGFLGLILVIPAFLIFAKNTLFKLTIPFFSCLGIFFFLNAQISGATYNMNEFWVFFVIILYQRQTIISIK